MKKIFIPILIFTFCISKLTAQTVTTYATLTSNPVQIAIDGLGNVYTLNEALNPLSFQYDISISKINSGGTVTNTALVSNSDYEAGSMAIDKNNNVYVSITDGKIIKISSAGIVINPWATLPSGYNPDYNGMIFDKNGNLFVSTASAISKISSSASVTAAWATLATYAYPYGMVFDNGGNLYTANYYANTISKISSNGTSTNTWANLTVASDGPRALAIDANGNIYSANYVKGTIAKITALGVVTDPWVTLASPSTAAPYDIVIDGGGNLYTANFGTSTISKVTPAGVVTDPWATLPTNSGPYAIKMDATGNLYTANNNINTVSKITGAVPFAVLPLNLLNFSGIVQNNINILNWQTATEINTKDFEIEHSSDGSNWSAIGTVAAKGSGGNTYSYTDNTATSSVEYYRLKMVDKDGNFSYSSVVKLSNDPTNIISVYPNPAREMVTIAVGKNYLNTMAKLINTNGQVLENVLLINNQTQLNVQNWSNGIYYLKFNDGAAQKIVVNH